MDQELFFLPENGSKSSDEEMVLLKGRLEKIVFQNPENDFTVARVNNDDEENPFTAVGNFGALKEGEHAEFKGEWVRDPRFGLQLKVFNYRIIYPRTQKGIINFLSSGIGNSWSIFREKRIHLLIDILNMSLT